MPDEIIANAEGTLDLSESDKVFTDAFEKAQEQAEDITPDPSKNEPPAKTAEEIAAEAKAAEDKAAADAQAGDEGKPKQQPGESDEAFEQRWKTLQGIYRHEKDEWTEEKTKLTAELEELRKNAPPPPDKETDSTLKELLSKLDLTDEQKAAMAEYDAEFDIVSKMEGLKRDNAVAKLKAEMLEKLNSFEEKLQTQLEPVNSFVKQTAKEKEEADNLAHFNFIKDKHPDFAKYRDDGSLVKWIETKPAYIQKGMQLAYSQGTAEDIVALLDGFKEENNIEVEKKGEVIDINKAKEERKAALTPPVTRRGAVNASMAVATDFEGAFDEALNKSQR